MEESMGRKLLVRFVQGKCNAEETRLVKNFLLKPEWQQALDELLEEDFRNFEVGLPDDRLSKDWNRRFQEKYIASPVRPMWRRPWLGYAAACILMLSIGLYFFNGDRIAGKKEAAIAMLETLNPRGQRSKILLPDSSVVYLGADSRIRYPEKFGAGNREISLTGEAFFEITKDHTHPFIIHTGEVQTKVLGTSFKVNAFDGKDLSVSVATGKVQVGRKIAGTDSLQSLAVLIPGQEVKWNVKTQTAAVDRIDAEGVRDWKDGTMTFVAASVGDIAENLERWYNVKINFQERKIAKYHVSLIVKGTDPLAHTLDIICNTTHLHYKIKGRIITITKKGG
ncbi:FecR family protein [Pedobacter sp. AW31-3R]|uniref:FecR family protein n=1 Tax=Pedobacter sp. AW31-3R TaxID=3445781 RepID=UPI003FA04F7D